ncbi:RNA-binding cell elongation regulator Jag/EloR [Murdochiella vaginalis]|uniref:RNA-binding cell elongation regulator Jag/EloR n=1 Tax=Murdochiella vaginalis TaxID=1852373 RepID=UPI0008FE01D4|nr:RNA-binding cell elongation regulator Jag/EloR [Murdochiella vaginalis]
MQSIVKTGKTVDEAVQAALQALDATLDDVSIEIMEEAKSGFLGVFGTKEAIVRVSRKESTLHDVLHEKKPAKPVAKKEQNDKTASASAALNTAETKPEAEKVVSKAPEAKVEVAETKAEEPDTEAEAKGSKAEVPSSLPQEDAVAEKPAHSLLDRIHEEVEREQSKQEISLVGADKESSASQKAPSAESASTEEAASAESTSVKKSTTPTRELDNVEIIRFSENWLSSILEEMHITAQLNFFIEEENLRVEMTDISETDMGIVIGRRAETLNAIQYLLGVTLNRISKRHYRVYLDVGDYRKRRAQNITRLAERNAEKVRRSKRSVKLEPMNAYERRIVHTALQDMEHIETVSEGREPHRKVVILYKE